MKTFKIHKRKINKNTISHKTKMSYKNLLHNYII